MLWFILHWEAFAVSATSHAPSPSQYKQNKYYGYEENLWSYN